MLKILLIEDSVEDALLLQHELRRNDFQAQIERVDSVEGFKTALERGGWDLIISDYSLPHFNALNALAVFKSCEIDLPFIVISGAIGDELAVAVMKAGANDFISKNNLARLVPVIERELRESQVRTDRKKAEEALKISEEKYHSLFNGVPVGIYRCTPDGTIIEANQAFSKLFCYENIEQLQKIKLIDLFVCKDDYLNWRSMIESQSILKGFEVQMRRGDGAIIWVKESTSAKYSGEGEIIYFEGIMEDITEHKRAEETASKLLSGIENATEMVLITDHKGAIEFVNPAFEKITGYQKEEIIGRSPGFLKSGQQDEAYYKEMWNVIQQGNVWSGTLINKKKSGEYYDEEMTIAPVKNRAGNVINFVAIKRDVTERKKLLEQVLQGKKEWEATFDSVSDLIILVDVNGKKNSL